MNLTAAAALNTSFSASSANGGRSQFELRVGPFVGTELAVVSFTGREALNEPFVYEVLFSASRPEEELHLGTRGLPACLSIHTPAPHEPRVIQGLVVDFGAVDTPTNELAAGRRRYFLWIAPRLWNLQNNSKRRVFQGKTAIEIACAVLREHGIVPDLQVQKDDYPAIPFEYQNNETDLDFIRRVLATAGVFFYFRHANGLLDAVIPGAGIASAELGAAASAAAGLGGQIASAAGFLSDKESALGLVTTLVLADRSASTEQLGDTSLDVAQKGLSAAGGPGTGTLTNALGPMAGAVAGAVAINTGASDPLTYDANGQAGYTDTERVFTFSLGDPLVPKQVHLRHWDVRGAASFNATASVASVTAGATVNALASVSLSQPVSLGLNASGSLDVDSPSIAPSEASVFEYGCDPSLPNVPFVQEIPTARRALTQSRAGALPGRGTSDSRRIAPGYRFLLQNHPVGALNVEYLVTEIRCEAANPDFATVANVRDYQCTFRCVPSRLDPLPKKPTPKEHAPEPAVVIGPRWGDVHCDDMQRILVRLRWAAGDGYAEDGEGVCRVHLLDVWGGNGYGMQAIPRAGSEVMVAFFEGGEPIAMGQLRSKMNRPAFDTPHEVTKVGIKSRVIPNGRASEMSIDDGPDKAKILLRSSDDLVTEVHRNTTATHGGDYNIEITGERRETSSGKATLLYGKDVTQDVLGTLQDQVGTDRIVVTDGAMQEWVGSDVSRFAGGRVDATVHGAHHALYEGDSLERHFGHRAVVVADPMGAGAASACLHVEGAARAYALKEIQATSPEGFTISCGDSHITIRKDSVTIASPTIAFIGKTVQVTASDTAAIAAKTATVSGADTVTVSGTNKATVASQSASVVLDTNATVQGSAVKLGSGSGAANTSPASAKPKTVSTLKLSDADGKPFANQRVVLRKGGEGGEERVLVLDANGTVEVEGDDPIDVFFPDNQDAKA